MELYIGLLVVLSAYFIKGFSGFGPALIMIPSLSLLYDPMTAILITAFLDFLAGFFLLIAVRRDIVWSFVFPVFLALAAGALIGTLLLDQVSIELLKKVIGVAIILFAIVIFNDTDRQKKELSSTARLLRYPIGFLSGILGGLLSISGPPLVIYMKWFYEKSFFRTQLISIFLLGTGWRLFLYKMYDIPSEISNYTLILFFLMMIAGLIIGNRIHLVVREITFNRIIALIIVFPALRLLFP